MSLPSPTSAPEVDYWRTIRFGYFRGLRRQTTGMLLFMATIEVLRHGPVNSCMQAEKSLQPLVRNTMVYFENWGVRLLLVADIVTMLAFGYGTLHILETMCLVGCCCADPNESGNPSWKQGANED